MTRRYGEPVEVRPVQESGPGTSAAPDSFLWRGRLYVVRSVLGHWRERRSWWAGSLAGAVHGEVSARPVAAADRRSALHDEREVWRVRASAGRIHGSGVYDLCRDPGDPHPGESHPGDQDQAVGGTAGPARSWTLLHVAD